jgi:hypothetical protein
MIMFLFPKVTLQCPFSFEEGGGLRSELSESSIGYFSLLWAETVYSRGFETFVC